MNATAMHTTSGPLEYLPSGMSFRISTTHHSPSLPMRSSSQAAEWVLGATNTATGKARSKGQCSTLARSLNQNCSNTTADMPPHFLLRKGNKLKPMSFKLPAGEAHCRSRWTAKSNYCNTIKVAMMRTAVEAYTINKKRDIARTRAPLLLA